MSFVPHYESSPIPLVYTAYHSKADIVMLIMFCYNSSIMVTCYTIALFAYCF